MMTSQEALVSRSHRLQLGAAMAAAGRVAEAYSEAQMVDPATTEGLGLLSSVQALDLASETDSRLNRRQLQRRPQAAASTATRASTMTKATTSFALLPRRASPRRAAHPVLQGVVFGRRCHRKRFSDIISHNRSRSKVPR